MNLPSDLLPRSPLVLDASVIFNILATGFAADIIDAIGLPCLVEVRTRREVKRHPRPDATNGDPLEPLIVCGAVQIATMSSTAYRFYLGLVSGDSAAALGDGESAAIALAADANHAVALDDGKARAIRSRQAPHVATVSSLGLIVGAAQARQWTAEKLRHAISDARKYARMGIVVGERGFFKDVSEALGLLETPPAQK
ncbi:hypothetical protein [Burkholderia contaminans]|uniref:hypothetical protein n=1 Tax=Burkholderia contaminans TaxID=488447 RepID=UPI000F56B786|nr:hypothetical protein [Burkholderia contaminans]